MKNSNEKILKLDFGLKVSLTIIILLSGIILWISEVLNNSTNLWAIYTLPFLMVFLFQIAVEPPKKMFWKHIWKYMLIQLSILTLLFIGYKYFFPEKTADTCYWAVVIGIVLSYLIEVVAPRKLYKEVREWKKQKAEKEWADSYELRKNAVNDLEGFIAECPLSVDDFIYEDWKESCEFLQSKGYIEIIELPGKEFHIVISKDNMEKIKSKIKVDEFLNGGSNYEKEKVEKYSQILFK